MSTTLPIGRKAACDHCAFWQRVAERQAEGYQDEGLCRRHAPAAVPSREVLYDGTEAGGLPGLLAAWPRTFGESDWCGDYMIRQDIEVAGRDRPDA